MSGKKAHKKKKVTINLWWPVKVNFCQMFLIRVRHKGFIDKTLCLRFAFFLCVFVCERLFFTLDSLFQLSKCWNVKTQVTMMFCMMQKTKIVASYLLDGGLWWWLVIDSCSYGKKFRNNCTSSVPTYDTSLI